MRWYRSLSVSLLVASSGCLAHEGAVNGPGASPVAAPAVAPMAPSVTEEPRFGTVGFKVSCSAAAQHQFDQAVGALHSFFYPETVKAFGRVLELDPGCAMAYWGIARSQLPNPLVQPFPPGTWQRGREAVARGLALGPATPREREWLEAAGAFFDGPEDQPYRARVQRYRQAMERLADHYPEDVEATAFYALALLESADPHDRTFDDQLRAARRLAPVMASHPNHPGVTHYLIHAYDYSPIAGQGLASANAYASIAPSAPHALHMPSHIYSMLGLWKQVLVADRAALAVARDYAARSFPPGTTYVGVGHSLDFMEYAYLQLGMDREAERVVAEAQSITRTNVPSLAADTAVAAIPVRYTLERDAWGEAAALPPRPSAYPYAEAVRLFGRALGAARLGDPDHLAQSVGDLERMETLRAASAATLDQAYWAEQIEVLIDVATAWRLQAMGDGDEALGRLRRAAELEEASEKHVAMENRLLPAREQLGDLLLERHLPEQALVEYQASLLIYPARARSLAGAARAAALAGQAGLARHYFELLRDQTAGADGQRPGIEAARASLLSAR
jgi:tetratricopeptide (TPR) repeat protein